MKVYLSNAFSIQMLDIDNPTWVNVHPVKTTDVRAFLEDNGFTSAIGHKDLAAVVSDLISLPVEANRINVKLDSDSMMLVAQYSGGRLPEGTTTLPQGSSIKFYLVTTMPG